MVTNAVAQVFLPGEEVATSLFPASPNVVLYWIEWVITMSFFVNVSVVSDRCAGPVGRRRHATGLPSSQSFVLTLFLKLTRTECVAIRPGGLWSSQILGFQGPELIFYFAVAYWTIDICWSFNTAYFKDGVLIKERTKIAWHYARTWLPSRPPQPATEALVKVF